jgi:hypothetical protein
MSSSRTLYLSSANPMLIEVFLETNEDLSNIHLLIAEVTSTGDPRAVPSHGVGPGKAFYEQFPQDRLITLVAPNRTELEIKGTPNRTPVFGCFHAQITFRVRCIQPGSANSPLSVFYLRTTSYAFHGVRRAHRFILKTTGPHPAGGKRWLRHSRCRANPQRRVKRRAHRCGAICRVDRRRPGRRHGVPQAP